MIRTLYTVLIVATALLAVSCSYTPRSTTVNEYILAFRADYLQGHPDGEYNQFIQRGEVVRGMDFLAVLASWGHPKKREIAANSSTECWYYVVEDESSTDKVAYKFTFRGTTLHDWDVGRQIAKTGRLMDLEKPAATVLTRGDLETPDQVPTKKRF